MSKRPTPETDAAAEEVGMGHFMVDADFSRRLEQERDEAREAYEIISSKWQKADEQLAKTLRENARMQESLKKLLLIAENGIPDTSHEGSCGPWSPCDGNCEARAYCAEYIEEAKRILSNAKGEAQEIEKNCERLQRQRDEAREKYFAMRDLSNNATELAEKYKRERDELLKSQAVWISTEDKMPDPNVDVILATEDGHVEAGYCEAAQWHWLTGHEILIDVTHWMPFPEHPETRIP